MYALPQIREQLSKMKPALVQKYPISSIGLFGSVVRDDFRVDSDIDIVVDFHTTVGIEFMDLANELEMMLRRKVDLVSRKGIKPAYLLQIEPEIVYV